MIQALFPPFVVTAEAVPPWGPAALYPEEEALVSTMVPARRSEFAAGRASARAALKRLGVPPAPILADARRVPVWPSGVIGSITHCAGYCGCAVARSGAAMGLGVDVEVAAPLPDDIREAVSTPRERQSAGLPPLLLFSAKESVFKACFPLTRIELDFREVEIELGSEAGTFVALLPGRLAEALGGVWRLAGRYAVTSDFVATGVVLARAHATVEATTSS
ncbi:MAG: 4'-phosphopantetheinyl transferase superfamily protein [Gemmatimonadales bacterium]|nr:4'-phosphopantetheinyl transferase superfamily protein [Gemmatimonadales bacterium]